MTTDLLRQEEILPLHQERIQEVKQKLLELVAAKVPHVFHVTWRMKAVDALEEPGDPVEWQGVASANAQGEIEISFVQRPGNVYGFPRLDVEYIRFVVKRTQQEMPNLGGPMGTKTQGKRTRPEVINIPEENHREHRLQAGL